MFLCDTLIEGSVCESEGMAIYVTHDDTPTRPSTFYPIDHTQWAFSSESNSEYLGVSSSDYPNVSGKFSGVFTAPYSATFYFQLSFSHTVTGSTCYLNLSENPLFIEVDLNYSGTGSDGGYGYWYKKNYHCSSATTYTNLFYLQRKFTFVKGEKYPLFAGMRYNVTIPAEAAPWMKLTWYLSYSYQSLITTETAVAGLSGYSNAGTDTTDDDSSSTSGGDSSAITSSAASSSSGSSGDSSSGGDGSSSTTVSYKKTNGAVVAGSCIGGLAAVVIAVVAFWAFSTGRLANVVSAAGPGSRRRSSNGSARSGSRSGSGRSGRGSKSRGSKSRKGSGRASRESRSRGGSGRSSGESDGSRSSGRSSRESSGSRGSESAGSRGSESAGSRSSESVGSRSSGRTSSDRVGHTTHGGNGLTTRGRSGRAKHGGSHQRGASARGSVPRVGN